MDDENIATVKLVKDIDLTSVLGVAHYVTIDFCGKKINASGDMIEDEQCVIQVLNTKTSANKLTFKNFVGGGEFSSLMSG